MYPEFIDSMFEDRVKSRQDLMYKVLDRDDREYQGLYKQTFTYYLDGRGMGINLKQEVEKGDIFLIDIFLEEDNALIKACCEAASCELREDGTYNVRLDFIIIKDTYKQCWEEFIFRKMQAEVV